jgi:aspartokinase-like uncharacterized kinase
MGQGEKSGLTIVKLGGSLIGMPELRAWLAAIAGMAGPRLVVPGGGPFADAVRRTQEKLGFDDLVAHRMAILAMQQYGLLLAALEPRLRLAESEADLWGLLEGEGAGVWLPWAMIGRDDAIPPSWEITSDSLALILATRLGARRLWLVKAGEVPPGEHAAEELARIGLVDATFPGLLAAFQGEARIVHVKELAPSSSACRVVTSLPAASGSPM